MNIYLKFAGIGIVAATVFALVAVVPQTATSQQVVDKPVEQVRKNIQVLQGLPDSQLFLVMNFVGDSLGVHCDYCHVKGEKNPQTGSDTWLWEKDDKRTKSVGRNIDANGAGLESHAIQWRNGGDLLHLSSWEYASGAHGATPAERLC